MNSQIRERMILAALLLKILEPRLQQYGITLTTADLVDLIGGAVVVWHTVVAPILARFAVPPSQPVAPAGAQK